MSAGHAIASYHQGRPIAIQMVALARESPAYNSVLLCSADGLFGWSVPSGNEVQGGPSQIKVLITNHCPDCTMLNVDGQVQGHFDINQAPGGWDNPKIYYQQIDNSQCM